MKKLFGKRSSSEDVSVDIVNLFAKAVKDREALDVFLGEEDAFEAYRKLGKEAPLRSSSMLDLDREALQLKIEYIFPRTPVFKFNPLMLFFSVDGQMYFCSTTIAAIDRANETITVNLPGKVHRNERRKAFRIRIAQFNVKVSVKNITKTETAHSSGQVKAYDYEGKVYDISEGGMFFMSFASMDLNVNDVLYVEFTLPGIDLLPRTTIKSLVRAAHVKSFNRFCGMQFYYEGQKNIPYYRQHPYALDPSDKQFLAKFCRAANIGNLEREQMKQKKEEGQAEGEEEQQRRSVVLIGDRAHSLYNNPDFEQFFQKFYISDSDEVYDFVKANPDAIIVYDNLADSEKNHIDFAWSSLVKRLRSSNLFHPVYVIDRDPMEQAKWQKLKDYKIFYCSRLEASTMGEFLKFVRKHLPQ
nr:PilZ domain-containing protein [Desulfurispira natronophila]